MQKQAAVAVCAKASTRTQTDWTKADDLTLVRGVIARNDGARLEFRTRFDALLNKRIRTTLASASFALATTDMIEEIKRAVFAYLMTGHMKPLRAFDPRYGTMANWMSRLGLACARRKLETLTTIPCAVEGIDADTTTDKTDADNTEDDDTDNNTPATNAQADDADADDADDADEE